MKNLSSTNEDCFEICRYLRLAFEETSSEYGMAGSIFTTFFHDLVIHFTGIVIHRAAQYEYSGEPLFPWVNKSYALSPFVYSDDQFSGIRQSVGFYDDLKRHGVIPVSIGESIPLGYRQNQILSNALKIFTYRPNWVSVYLPNRKSQLSSLQSRIFELCKNFSISNDNAIQRNWVRYVLEHSTDKQTTIRRKGILVGTRNNLHNRKLALNYLQQDKEVVGFTHGEINNDVLDEPVYGYSDKALCTTLVDYGSFASTNLAYPPIIPPKHTLRRSSPVIRSRYEPCREIVHRNLENSRVLLIPTMYQQNHLYGPKHAYESGQYYEWHKAIERCIPDLTIKMHPKTRSWPNFDCTVDYRQLENCINEYDVLILDYFATSTVLAIFSNKPVIYFDIGLRTLEPSFQLDFNNRCTTVTVEFEMNWEEQIRAGLNHYHVEKQTFSNVNLEKYSLCSRDEFSITRVLLDILRS